MDREYFTNLTNDLYRLTLLFPKKEPLKYKLRDLADNVLANLVLILEGDEKKFDSYIHRIRENIGPLDSFFEVVKKQNWVSQDDINDIQQKYQVIKEETDRFEKIEKPVFAVDLNKRQSKIVEILKKEERVQVNDIQTVFPKVTKRTLRRDFEALIKSGMVKREGRANMTYYKLADNQL
ncbi:MAG: DeoR family transcriptional regulator [Minisyncoccales bacterium]|jgi:DNA-binding transcriptional ArsR family regulator